MTDGTWIDSAPWRAAREQLGLEFLVDFYGVAFGVPGQSSGLGLLDEPDPHYLQALMELGHLYTQLGEYAKGLEMDHRLAHYLPSDPTVIYNLACSQSLVGEIEGALESLEQAVACGYDDVEHLLADDDLSALRGEERFRDLVRWLETRGTDGHQA